MVNVAKLFHKYWGHLSLLSSGMNRRTSSIYDSNSNALDLVRESWIDMTLCQHSFPQHHFTNFHLDLVTTHSHLSDAFTKYPLKEQALHFIDSLQSLVFAYDSLEDIDREHLSALARLHPKQYMTSQNIDAVWEVLITLLRKKGKIRKAKYLRAWKDVFYTLANAMKIS